MGVVSVLWGVLALCWMVVALIPLLGAANWFLIPFAAVGAIIGALGIMLTRRENRGRAKTGLIINLVVIVVAIARLHLGFGVI